MSDAKLTRTVRRTGTHTHQHGRYYYESRADAMACQENPSAFETVDTDTFGNYDPYGNAPVGEAGL